MQSGLYSSGWFDAYMLDTDEVLALKDAPDRTSLSQPSSSNSATYFFRFRPQVGLLNSLKPLLPKTEITLSFDRAPCDLALITLVKNENDPYSGKVLDLKNVFLSAEYISSPHLRDTFNNVRLSSRTYNYDEISVYNKAIPQNETIVRFPNIVGGNTPNFIFAGILESEALNGSLEKSSTKFQRSSVQEFDLTLNGFSCSGFPISVRGSEILV